jgi:DNA polymerase II small subunit/DNA polymerase delta subunit B
MLVLFVYLSLLLAHSWLAPTYPSIVPCLPECPSWFALTPGWFLSNLL